jgi:class 3 adenylate cyclase
MKNSMIETNIAIVLTDIIGSTKFVQKNGSYNAAKWFGLHDRYVMNFIARHNGQLVDASDGHLMYFASVQDAVAFSFEYKKFLKKKNIPFKSRVGIHWDKMLIVKSEEHMVRAGGKRINLEGIGKNIAARTMSICGPEQILLSHNAFKKFKERTKQNRFIPSNAKIALVGLYQFKGVKKPEQIYALGTEEAHIQPPPSGEKVKRLGGKKKIKVRLRNKNIKEVIYWIFYRVSILTSLYIIYGLFHTANNFHSNNLFFVITGIDLSFYLEDINYFFKYLYEFYKK